MDGNGGPSRYEALARLLESIGVSVDMRQREAVRDVLMTAGELSTDTLAAVIASVLARSARQQQRILEFLPHWLEPPAPEATSEASVETPNEPSARQVAKTPTLVQASTEIGRIFVAEVRASNTRTIVVATAPLLALGAGAAWFGLQTEAGSGLGLLRAGLGSLDVNFAYLLWASTAVIAVIPVGFVVIKLVDAVVKWLEARRNRPKSEGIRMLPKGSTYFAFEAVGGGQMSLFSRRQIQKIARAVPHRATNIEGRRLDAANSVIATARRALPTLRFRALREPWPVVVLADRSSAARAWSDLPAQLVAGLAVAGVDATLGQFPGRLDRFDIDGIGRVDLIGLFSQFALLLLVSDGGALRARESGDVAAMRRLADSGRAIWIDEREQRFWRPYDPQFSTRMPVCAATATGIEEALRALGPQKSSPIEFRELFARLPGAVAEAQAATVLGDALGWAAACAMLQPIGVALAQNLRDRFFDHLEPIAFGRLMLLQGATLTSNGLRFEAQLMARLRTEFARRLPAKLQDDILAVLKEVVERPPGLAEGSLEKGSLAYQTWRWHRARFLLDADPDEAVEALREVQASLLAPEMRRELARLHLPGDEGGGRSLPLLRMPNDVPAFAAQLAELGSPISSPDVSGWSFPAEGRQVHFSSSAIKVAAVPESAEILAIHNDGAISIGSLDKLEPRFAGSIGELREHPNQPLDAVGAMMAVSPGGRILAVAYKEARQPLQLFDLVEPANRIELPSNLLPEMSTGVDAIAFSHRRSMLAVAGHESVALIEIATAPDAGRPTAVADFIRRNQPITALAVSRDDRRVFLATQDCQIVFVDTKQPEEKGIESVSIDLPTIEAVAAGPEGFLLVAVGGEEWLAVDKEGITHGPWPVPARLLAGLPTSGPAPRPLLSVVDDDPVVALLLGERLAILHLRTGADLLRDDPGHAHVALGFSQGFALLRGKTERDVTAHPFRRPHASGAQP